MEAQADPGSFRDPTSRVFVDGDGVWRGLTEDALADFEALADPRVLPLCALDRGDIVGTELATDDPPPDRPASGPACCGTSASTSRSYPYEWPFEMLRDAALPAARADRGRSPSS